MKIARVVFSTNRPEYLRPTLEAARRLEWGNLHHHNILIDDMPRGRDDKAIRRLAGEFGFEDVLLHSENMGIGRTWQETFDRLRDDDYVLHHEDDVVLLRPVSVPRLVRVLYDNPAASQVVLKRQPWYPHERDAEALPDDIVDHEFRGEYGAAARFFTPIFSLYPIRHARRDYRQWWRTNYPRHPEAHNAFVNEALIGQCLFEGEGLRSLHLKHHDGSHLIEHIGAYTIGRKLNPGEPGWANWSGLDPTQKYWSGTNVPITRPFVPPT